MGVLNARSFNNKTFLISRFIYYFLSHIHIHIHMNTHSHSYTHAKSKHKIIDLLNRKIIWKSFFGGKLLVYILFYVDLNFESKTHTFSLSYGNAESICFEIRIIKVPWIWWSILNWASSRTVMTNHFWSKKNLIWRKILTKSVHIFFDVASPSLNMGMLKCLWVPSN